MFVAACLAAVASIPAGTLPARADFVAAPCAGEVSPALRYDAARRALTAARDIAAGELITSVPLSLLPDVSPGAPLTLVTRVGTATVERQVTAVQPGRNGRSIFVRTSDGRLIAAPLAMEAGQ